ncbi:MAG: AbrB family transcriptional regulator [Pseudomonadota bacterium]
MGKVFSTFWPTFGTLLAATLGGLAFFVIGLPAPWIAGAMVAVTVLVVRGFPAIVPDGLRIPAFIFLGMSVGTGLSPETLDNIAKWPGTIAGLIVLVVAITGVTGWYFQNRHGWDQPTAFFASLPGALSTTMMLASTSAANVPRVALAQSIRLFVLIALLPLLVAATSTEQVQDYTPPVSSALDLAVTLAASVVAAWLFHLIRFPAGVLVGPMVASGGLHLLGLVEGRLPDGVLFPGFIVLGALIGARFVGARGPDLRHYLGAGLGGFAVGVTISLAMAAAFSAVFGLPFGQVLLAFAPGGLEAMTVMAFALNLDPAFVATHQLVRFVGMSLIVPLVAARLGLLRDPSLTGKAGAARASAEPPKGKS